MAQEKILEARTFHISRKDMAKRIRIADPLYLKELREGSTNKNLLKLTMDEATHKTNRFIDVEIQKMEYTYTKKEDDFDCISNGWVVYIHILKEKDGFEVIRELLRRNRIFATKELKHLGCDTAQFLLNNHNIRTLSDGFYGTVFLYKNTLGMTIELFWDSDAYARGGDIQSFEGIENLIRAALKEEPSDDVY